MAVSNTFSIAVVSSTTPLSTAAAGLSSGQSLQWDHNAGNAPGYQELIYVSTTAFYDSSRKEIQYLGKGAGASGNFNHRHFIYDEATRAWRTTGTNLFPDFGHAWICALDHTAGDYFFHRNQQNNLEWMVRATEAGQGTTNSPWTTTASPPGPTMIRPGSGATQAAMAWHPNLFGTGDGGVWLWQSYQFSPQDCYMWTWRKSNNTWYQSTNYYGTNYYAHQSGQGTYISGLDRIILGASGGTGGRRLISVAANAGTTHAFTDLGAGPPVSIIGNSSGSGAGVLLQDPTNASYILCLEKVSPWRYWRSTDGGVVWTQIGNHGFSGLTFDTAGSWIACSIPAYGIVWAMADDGCSAGNVRIWKP